MNKLKDSSILALTDINSLPRNDPNFTSNWRSMTHLAANQHLSGSPSSSSPSFPDAVCSFWGGEDSAICSCILTKVSLAHVLSTDFLATEWSDSKMDLLKNVLVVIGRDYDQHSRGRETRDLPHHLPVQLTSELYSDESLQLSTTRWPPPHPLITFYNLFNLEKYQIENSLKFKTWKQCIDHTQHHLEMCLHWG